MTARRLPNWFSPGLRALVVEVFLLIALGGGVRTMNAGLACPDWPLCFGDFIPDYHPQVYLEFIHRVMGGVVAITTAILAYALFRSDESLKLKLIMGFTLALLSAQIIVGGLTVLKQLQSGIVATHLGTSFFALLYWLHLQITKVKEPAVTSDWQRIWSYVVLIAVFSQIILGGLVASNYAANVCPDFPTCQGQWIPTLSGPIGLQVLHRFNAYLLVIIIAVNWLLNRDASPRAKTLANGMLAIVAVQVGLGIANVLLTTPPLVSVLHLATATALLGVSVRQLFMNQAARPLVTIATTKPASLSP